MKGKKRPEEGKEILARPASHPRLRVHSFAELAKAGEHQLVSYRPRSQ
jgi:hypothetical protein